MIRHGGLGITSVSKSLLGVIREMSELGHKGAKEVRQEHIHGFKVYHVKEPYLSIGREKILYPLEFRDVRKFYTSNISLRIRVKPFIADRRGNNFLEDIKGIANKYQKRYNFYIDFENPVYEYNVDRCITYMVDYMKNVSQSNQQNKYIVMPIAGKLHDYRYNLIKAFGTYYKIPTHIINLDKVDEILRDCKRKNQRREKCPGFIAYMLNNYVQLYAKAGGIPWVVSDEDAVMLQNTAVVGLAVSKLGDTGYLVGVSYSIAYVGKEVRSYIYSEVFEETELDIESLKTTGLYIPARVVENIFIHIKNSLSAWGISKYVIFQSTIIHPDEIKGLTEVLKDNVWILAHVKETGFTKRVYDLDTNDYGPYRGTCLIDEDSLGGNGPVKALLLSTGIIRTKKYDYELQKFIEEEKRTYKPNTTPEPLELEILYSSQAETPVNKMQMDTGIALYTCRLALLLGKLDWEAYTSWPKRPFVEKYAKRIADILSSLYARGDEKSISFAKDLMAILQREVRALRYIM